MAGPFSLTFMSGGNKAWLLTVITCCLIASGGIVFVVGPNAPQDTGEEVISDDIFDIDNTLRPRPPPTASPAPNAMGATTTPAPTGSSTPKPTPLPLFLPSNPLPNVPAIATPRPSPLPTPIPTPQPVVVNVPKVTTAPTLMPVFPQPTTSAKAPIPGTPTIGRGQRQYPFAVVFECDWQGNRLSLTTRTISSSVVRLCIEAPPLPPEEEPVEIAQLSWFIFTRQPYDDQVLDPLTQHAVIVGKADPFGLTVLNCPAGVRICRFASDLRDEFFTDDAFLVGRGELALRFVQNPTEIAGVAPISIYFLLSAIDIMEPLQLGRQRRQADPALAAALAAANSHNSNKNSYVMQSATTTTTTSSRPVGRGRRKQNAFRNKDPALPQPP